jgi:adenylate cyclase
MERVVELDPKFAGGYSSISSWLALRVRQGQSASPQADIERAFQLAQKAVAVDNTFAHSYVALSNAYLMKGEHDKAVAAAQESVRIQPNYAGGYERLGYMLHWAGQGAEAINALKTAMQLDPKPSIRRAIRRAAYLGMAYFTAGRYEDAVTASKKHRKRRVRRGSLGLGIDAAAHAATGQIEKARAVMKALLEKKPGLTISNYGHLRRYKRSEDRKRLVNLLRKAGMPE